MRASSRPHSTIPKAASWPLISGSLVGNKSSCLDGSLTKGLLCFAVLSLFVFVESTRFGIVNPNVTRGLNCACDVDVFKYSGVKQLSGLVYERLYLFTCENKVGVRLLHDFFSSGQYFSLAAYRPVLKPFGFKWLRLFNKDKRRFRPEIPSWRSPYVKKDRLNDVLTINFERAHSHIDNLDISTVDHRQVLNLPLHDLPLLGVYTDLPKRNKRLHGNDKKKRKTKQKIILILFAQCTAIPILIFVYLFCALRGTVLLIENGISVIGIAWLLGSCVAVGLLLTLGVMIARRPYSKNE